MLNTQQILEKLMQHIKENNQEEIRNLLGTIESQEEKVEIVNSIYCETRPLCWAIENGRKEIVQMLIDAGAKVNSEIADGITPLCLAATIGSLPILEALLDAGARVAIFSNFCAPENRRNPIYIIASRRQLLDQGMDFVARLVNALKVQGLERPISYLQSSLHVAVKNGDLELITFLLANGADGKKNYQRSRDKWTRLYYTEEQRLLDLALELLDKNVALNFLDKVEVMQNIAIALIRSGEPVAINPSAVRLATKHNLVTVLEEMAKQGFWDDAYASCIDISGDSSPLLIAVENGFVQAARILCNAGFKTDNLLRSNETLAHLAVKSGSSEMLEFVLSTKVDPNIPNSSGTLPLHLAVEFDQPAMVGQLLLSGANIAPDCNGKTPFHLAITLNRTQCLEIFLGRANAKELLALPASGSLALWNSMLDGSAGQKQGISPLLLALRYGHNDMAKMFIKRNADVNFMGSTSALILATERNNLEMVDLLLQNGANPWFGRRRLSEKDRQLSGSARALVTTTKEDQAKISRKLAASAINSLPFMQRMQRPVVDNQLQYPISIAVESGFEQIAIRLLTFCAERDQDFGSSWKNKDGDTLPVIAVKKGLVNLVVRFASYYKLREASMTITILMVAIEQPKPAVAIALIEQSHDLGIDLDQTNKEGITPLVAAIKAKQPAIVACLLNHGVYVELEPKKSGLFHRQSDLPLHIAVRTGQVDILQMLFPRYSDGIDVIGANEQTALYIAVTMGNAEMVQILCDHGANPYQKVDRMTVMELAESLKNQDIIDILAKQPPSKEGSRSAATDKCSSIAPPASNPEFAPLPLPSAPPLPIIPPAYDTVTTATAVPLPSSSGNPPTYSLVMAAGLFPPAPASATNTTDHQTSVDTQMTDQERLAMVATISNPPSEDPKINTQSNHRIAEYAV